MLTRLRLFACVPAELAHAPVFVHFHDRDAHVVECWGSLSESTLMRCALDANARNSPCPKDKDDSTA
jgi:hypothetical protein